MSEPHDPIDEWLSADVELLHPPPGTLGRIRRTARRRKAARALSTIASAAVVIAAAGTLLPQLVGGLGSQPAALHSKTTSPSSSTPSSRPSHPSPSLCPGPAYAASQAGAVALGSTGATAQLPAVVFRPTSVTFAPTGNGVVGAVIGETSALSSPGSCISMAGTPDYGLTWYKIGAPPAGPPHGAQGVNQVRFADTSNGWAYGPQLFATHDGGLTWKKITVHGRVIDLAAISGRVFAVVAYGCQGTSPQYAANCTSFALMSSPTQADDWRTVPGASTGIAEAPGGLQLSAQYGYLMTNGSLYAGPLTGGAWHLVSNASPSAPPCLRGGQLGPWLLAPGSPDVFLVCGTPGTSLPAGSLTLYRSADQGRSWQRQGTVPTSEMSSSLAVAPTSGWLVLATSTGIYYSTDETNWHRARLALEPAGGFTYIGMTTTLQGVAVPMDLGLGEIFTTTDGGRTWQPRRIR